MIIIKTKNKSFSGVIANITFVMGEGKVETLTEDDKAWFKKYGAEIIEENKNEKENESKTSKSKKDETDQINKPEKE